MNPATNLRSRGIAKGAGMNKDEILAKLQDVFRDFFGDDAVTLTDAMTSEDVKGWDSVSHIQLVFEVEEAFDVMFPADEIPKMTSVNHLIDRIHADRIHAL
jgi:acyl carrier protein